MKRLLRIAFLTLVIAAQVAEALVLYEQQKAVDAVIEASKAQDKRIQQMENTRTIRPVTDWPEHLDEARNEQ